MLASQRGLDGFLIRRAILRARMLPRGGAWLLILYAFTELGAILANMVVIVGFDGSLGWLWLVAAVVFGLGRGWLGYGLWSESRASEGQPSHASCPSEALRMTYGMETRR